MTAASTSHSTPRRPGVLVAIALAAVLVAGGCVVDDPSIAPTELATASAAPLPTSTVTAPQFQPTAPPDQATPTPPIPAPTVEPTPTPPPPTPVATPLPAETPNENSAPTRVDAGTVAVPVGGLTTFTLPVPRPVLQLPGHTLIYLDDNRQAEVDIFTPVADGQGNPLAGYDAVIAHVTTDPAYVGLEELAAVTIAGLPTRVFEGVAVTGERGFYTDLATQGNDSAGWFPPIRVRMWIIDTPRGPVVVSAESLEDPGQYSDAVRLATEILTTITFSP